LQRGREGIGVRRRNLEMHQASELAGDSGHAAAGPVRAEPPRSLGQLAQDGRPVGAVAVTTSDTGRRPSISDTLPRMRAPSCEARVCGCAGSSPAARHGVRRESSSSPIGANARSQSSRAVSPLATKHQSCAAIAPASQPSAR
jgi:hypothetical protein